MQRPASSQLSLRAYVCKVDLSPTVSHPDIAGRSLVSAQSGMMFFFASGD